MEPGSRWAQALSTLQPELLRDQMVSAHPNYLNCPALTRVFKALVWLKLTLSVLAFIEEQEHNDWLAHFLDLYISRETQQPFQDSTTPQNPPTTTSKHPQPQTFPTRTLHVRSNSPLFAGRSDACRRRGMLRRMEERGREAKLCQIV